MKDPVGRGECATTAAKNIGLVPGEDIDWVMPPNEPEERKPPGKAARPTDVTTETLVADRSLGAVPVGWDADMAVTALYSAHYRSLVRLAVLLVRDVATAEEVVQDAFVAIHGAGADCATPTRHSPTCVNRSSTVPVPCCATARSSRSTRPRACPTRPARRTARSASSSARRHRGTAPLPTRQREALVLRYYGDLSEAEIAHAMGISKGAVKSHTARGMAALRMVLEQFS